MKKILLVSVLLFSIFVSAQTQQRFVYENVTVIYDHQQETFKVETVIYLNYGSEAIVKIFPPNSAFPIYYECISPIEEGITDAGKEYYYGYYRKRDTDLIVLIQVFKDINFGVKFISRDAKTVVHFY